MKTWGFCKTPIETKKQCEDVARNLELSVKDSNYQPDESSSLGTPYGCLYLNGKNIKAIQWNSNENSKQPCGTAYTVTFECICADPPGKKILYLSK